MRILKVSAAIAACAIVSACGGGGGGGGVGTTPPPLPSPSPSPTPTPSPTPSPTPTPTAAAMLSLQPATNATFTSDATYTDVSFAVSDGITQSTSGGSQKLSIRYDAAARSYTVEGGGRSQVFNNSDLQPQRIDGEVMYAAANEFGAADFLTLVVIPYSQIGPIGPLPKLNSYVGMGYWQSNKISGGIQETDFNTFTYGLDTPLASIPRSGFASWTTDVFGLYTRPGDETRTLEGSGRFDIDFLTGNFTTKGYLQENDVVGGGGTSSPEFVGTGLLASNGTFQGQLTYQGLIGPMSARLYGPGAQEVGASFYATGSAGAIINGAMTGQRNSDTAPLTNMTLVNVAVPEILIGQDGVGGVKVGPGGPIEVMLNLGGISDLTKSASQTRDNFTTYDGKGGASVPLSVDFYKTGPENTEVALTYSSFATWHRRAGEALPSYEVALVDQTAYVAYGIQPLPNFVLGMTGTANYQGVAYGFGLRNGDQATYDVHGTSSFLVNFSAMTYSGTLSLNGVDTGGLSHDFGQYNFASTLTGDGLNYAQLHPLRDNFEESIWPVFFGPQGQEIGALFSVRTGTYGEPDTIMINGIAVAKR